MKRFSVKAPTRADLCGGTLDLWPLYTFCGHAPTLNVALDLFAEVKVTVEEANEFGVELIASTKERLEWTANRAAHEISPALRFPYFIVDYYFGLLAEKPKLRLQLEWSTQAPLRSGLGGSSTLGVALLKALDSACGVTETDGWQMRMLHWIKDVEAAFLKTPTGTQDYLAALYGGLHSFDSQPGKIVPRAFSNDVMRELSDRTLVLFSGEMHSSGLSNWELFKGAMEGNDPILRGIQLIRDLSVKMETLLRGARRDWIEIGKHLSEEWRLRRELFRVNTPRLDEIVSAVRSLPVLGVKVCGAAQGGSLLVLVDPARRQEVIGGIL